MNLYSYTNIQLIQIYGFILGMKIGGLIIGMKNMFQIRWSYNRDFMVCV